MVLSHYIIPNTHTHAHTQSSRYREESKCQDKPNFHSYPFPVSCPTGQSRTEYKALISLLRKTVNCTHNQHPRSLERNAVNSVFCPSPTLSLLLNPIKSVIWSGKASLYGQKNSPVQRPRLWQTGVAVSTHVTPARAMTRLLHFR